MTLTDYLIACSGNTNITAADLSAVLQTFISKIIVCECEKTQSQTSPQRIDIRIRYFGAFALPGITDITEEPEQDEGGQPELSAFA